MAAARKPESLAGTLRVGLVVATQTVLLARLLAAYGERHKWSVTAAYRSDSATNMTNCIVDSATTRSALAGSPASNARCRHLDAAARGWTQ
jgi:hypothetical protein